LERESALACSWGKLFGVDLSAAEQQFRFRIEPGADTPAPAFIDRDRECG
jgi:hypothetical protein